MRDFSFQIYRLLIDKLKEAGYQFQTFQSYIQNPLPRSVIIRHDIDVIAESALRFAKEEAKLSVPATYYFRTGSKLLYKPEVIKKVANLGHEVGYHYEDLSRSKGDYTLALASFKENLAAFREICSVKTVCMHGSSGSPHDNRLMWKHASLSDFDLIAEPYLSLNFNQVLYLSDTSQNWNGSKVALRDKVVSKFNLPIQTTWDLIDHINQLPDTVMLTIHPELWTKSIVGWIGIKALFKAHSLYKTHYRNRRVSRQQ